MAKTASSGVWVRRPGLTTARLLAWGGGVLCGLAAWWLALVSGGPYWSIGLALLLLVGGAKAGRRLLRVMERLGLFGRVALLDEALVAGRGPPVLLGRPFRVGITWQEATASHAFLLRDVGLGGGRGRRAETKAITVLAATVEQDGRGPCLVADDVRAPPLADVRPRGLSYHRTPIAAPTERVVRMHPQDLIALLRTVCGHPSCSVVTPPAGPGQARDPRHLLWPPWRTWVGVALLLGLGAYAGVLLLDLAPRRPRESVVRMLEREQGQAGAARARAEALVGQRVVVPAADGGRIQGRVTEAFLEAVLVESRTVWRAKLRILVEALYDERGAQLLDAGALPLGAPAAMVEVGQIVVVPAEQATAVSD